MAKWNNTDGPNRVNTGYGDYAADFASQLKRLEGILANQERVELEALERIQQARISALKEYADKKVKTEEDIAKRIIKFNAIANEQDLKAEVKKQVNIEKLKALELKKKQGKKGRLTEDEKKEIQKSVELELNEKFKRGAKLRKKFARLEAIEKARESEAALKQVFGASGLSLLQRREAFKENFTKMTDSGKSVADWGKVFSTAIAGLSDYAATLKQNINNIASYKGTIDTALQGSKSSTFMGSYWDRMSKNIRNSAAISPLVRQDTIANNIQSMVSSGIVFNVEQRAFLNAISDRIAGTFEATDKTLVQLVRIQQKDTTAGRLGMESALTSFLNNMYETTEYMKDLADSTRTNLLEAQALMTATSAAQFEYQVQKWAGSLYSVGMNNTSVGAITGALGQLAAGDISGINNGGVSNLLIMAANNAGLSIAEILQKGLDDSDTNKLMAAMVNYLAGIYNETKGSKVIQQQYASVFGLKASDLLAASNLSSSVNTVAKNGLSYSGMLGQLKNMANSMYARTSIGEMMSNVSSNFQYSLASGIASNPALYALYTASGLLKDLTGGIATPSFMGTGLNTTVADLMRVGALSGSLLSGLGEMIFNGSNGGITGANLLSSFGIDTKNAKITNVVRGTGQGLAGTGGMSYSSSGYVGNTEGSDVYNKTMTDANDNLNQQIQAQEEEETKLKTVDEHVVNIYNLLKDVVSGSSALHVSFGTEPGFWNRY